MSHQPWITELRVAPVLAKYLIESQFPELNPVNPELIGEGWDNFAYRINNDYVFRFPRRQLGAGLLEVEGKLLPFLSHCLPLPVPKPVFYGPQLLNINGHFGVSFFRRTISLSSTFE